MPFSNPRRLRPMATAWLINRRQLPNAPTARAQSFLQVADD